MSTCRGKALATNFYPRVGSRLIGRTKNFFWWGHERVLSPKNEGRRICSRANATFVLSDRRNIAFFPKAETILLVIVGHVIQFGCCINEILLQEEVLTKMMP